MKVEFVTPSSQVAAGDYASVIAPGVLGQFEVLPGHTALVAELETGHVFLQSQVGQDSERYVITGGILQVHGNEVRLLADASYSKADIADENVEQELRFLSSKLQANQVSDDSSIEELQAEEKRLQACVELKNS